MDRDIRESNLYREIEALYGTLRRPGTGQISDASEVHVSPNGKHAVYSGALVDGFEGTPPTRICLTELATAETRVLTFGPNADRLPKFSPDARHVAFLSDRHAAGDFQLYLLDPISGAARPAARVAGWVEYLHWSPDGQRILLGVASHGAEISSGQGATASKPARADVPSWMPAIETGDESHRWRRVWVYELATGDMRQVGKKDLNIWEAVWCGNDALAVVASPGPGEGLWYSAHLHLIERASGNRHEIHRPRDQLGCPAASPSGQHIAFVEAICSDRWIVAGELQLRETSSGRIKRVDTKGVDVTYTEWRSDRRLLVAGHREFETVVGIYDVTSDAFTEVWTSRDLSTGRPYAVVSGLDESGDCVLVGESFLRAPEIAVIRQGRYQPVKSFDLGYADHVSAIERVERVSWKASDGLEIHGWLLLPRAAAPHPLVMNVHGGPVWHSRPVWLGRTGVPFLILLERGYAIFFPNPRGSSGRGREFVRHVYGDPGGADACDLLAGLDVLVEQGIADPERLGVTGNSYGGFMASWLITQDARFAAAVPVAPHNNQVTDRLLSNIPQFMDLLLADPYNNPDGRYFARSPVMHAQRVRTPTLHICGALDRCTPPEEAEQFHSALLENGVESVLVTYPEEGHGIRKFPAVTDYAVRIVTWFEAHMPARLS